jgi:hypothetical protein
LFLISVADVASFAVNRLRHELMANS